MDWVVRDYETDETMSLDGAVAYAVYDVMRVALEQRDGRVCGVLLVSRKPVHRWPPDAA